MIFSTNEEMKAKKEGEEADKREPLLNVFFRSKNQRIFWGAEIRWLCRGAGGAVQVRIFVPFSLFLDLTFNLGKIGNKKTFGVQEKCFGMQGEAPLGLCLSPLVTLVTLL